MSRYRVIFTDNKQSKRGIMSLVLAVIGVSSLVYSLVISYKLEGKVPQSFGGALVVTLIMAVVGFCLGVAARLDGSKFRLVPMLGIIFNFLLIIALGALLWVGLK